MKIKGIIIASVFCTSMYSAASRSGFEDGFLSDLNVDNRNDKEVLAAQQFFASSGDSSTESDNNSDSDNNSLLLELNDKTEIGKIGIDAENTPNNSSAKIEIDASGSEDSELELDDNFNNGAKIKNININNNNSNERPSEDKVPNNNNKGGNHLLGAAVIGATVWLAYTAYNSEPVQNILQDLGIVSKKRTPRTFRRRARRARPRLSEFRRNGRRQYRYAY